MENHNNGASAPLSPETAAIVEATGIADTPMAWAPCLRCVHSTILQLADDQEEAPAGLDRTPPALVVYCGRMHRDIQVPVARCSGYEPSAEA